METYVQGKLGAKMLDQGQRLREKTEALGYDFRQQGKDMLFTKSGRIESVVNELMPICDTLGLDVDDLSLVERRVQDNSVRSTFEQGRIDR